MVLPLRAARFAPLFHGMGLCVAAGNEASADDAGSATAAGA